MHTYWQRDSYYPWSLLFCPCRNGACVWVTVSPISRVVFAYKRSVVSLGFESSVLVVPSFWFCSCLEWNTSTPLMNKGHRLLPPSVVRIFPARDKGSVDTRRRTSVVVSLHCKTKTTERTGEAPCVGRVGALAPIFK